ncbi:MAG: FKBP-type peptidyl-prolyl cis-trans isomerase [Prevotellaceae bacterium]|jgi:hypothetical protein|nr:FKBP-type peptidyl-prolyl cis-trans isomerase [Prevotellaceae bacterium]
MKLADITVGLTRNRVYELLNAAFKHRRLSAGMWPIALLLLALGAQAQTYTPLSKDVRYAIHVPGKGGVKVGRGCHVQLSLSAATQQGANVFEHVCWLPIGEEPSHNSFEASLMALSQGDSADFMMPAGMFSSSLISYPKLKGVAGSETLRVSVRVLRVVEPDIVLDDTYEKFCEGYRRYEKRLTQQYLQRHTGFKAAGDIWKKQKKQGNGKKVEKAGNAMLITYEGFFLNGAKFDSNGKDGQPFRYVRGQQWQVIPGLAMALAAMSEGEKAEFVFPSAVAFGAKGLADIVPPFTSVVYEVEVLKVIK